MQLQMFLFLSTLPISKASAFVSGKGWPAVSGRKKATNPATTETTPINTIGKGLQMLEVNSTC
jgi:hypothetical protein